MIGPPTPLLCQAGPAREEGCVGGSGGGSAVRTLARPLLPPPAPAALGRGGRSPCVVRPADALTPGGCVCASRRGRATGREAMRVPHPGVCFLVGGGGDAHGRRETENPAREHAAADQPRGGSRPNVKVRQSVGIAGQASASSQPLCPSPLAWAHAPGLGDARGGRGGSRPGFAARRATSSPARAATPLARPLSSGKAAKSPGDAPLARLSRGGPAALAVSSAKRVSSHTAEAVFSVWHCTRNACARLPPLSPPCRW